MNTPSPCVSCRFCQFNCITEDDPSDSAYCIVENGKRGDDNCPKYQKEEE